MSIYHRIIQKIDELKYEKIRESALLVAKWFFVVTVVIKATYLKSEFDI